MHRATVVPPPHTAGMATQLDLLHGSPVEDDWRIDDATRAIGRRGLARARAALAEATSRIDAVPDRSHHRTAA